MVAIADSPFQIEFPNGIEKPAHLFTTQLATRLLVVAMTTASMVAHTVDNALGRLTIASAELSCYKRNDNYFNNMQY